MEGLEQAAQEVRDLGGEAVALSCDVSDPAQVDRAAEAAEAAFGPIDIWVNNAMATVLAPAWEVTAEEFQRAINVTFMGYVHGTQAALRTMRPRNQGVIVQVGSALSYRAIPLQSAYCAAKFAIRGFTDSLRTELRHEGSGVHLTMVQMPALNTAQFLWCRTRLPRRPMPVPPIYQPEVAAQGIHYAAHAKRREVWVGGSTVATILGSALAPWLADRFLARTGFDGQQTDEAGEAYRKDNLFEPVAALATTRGPFNARAHGRSLQLFANTHRKAGAVVGAGVAVGLLLLGRRQ